MHLGLAELCQGRLDAAIEQLKRAIVSGYPTYYTYALLAGAEAAKGNDAEAKLALTEASDPGFPIDIYITTDIRTMVHVWVGKLSLETAVRSEHIEVIGPRELRQKLRVWFLYSPINRHSISNPHLTSLPDEGRKPVQNRT